MSLCGDAPISLAVHTPERLVCGGALCGIAQFGDVLFLLFPLHLRFPLV